MALRTTRSTPTLFDIVQTEHCNNDATTVFYSLNLPSASANRGHQHNITNPSFTLDFIPRPLIGDTGTNEHLLGNIAFYPLGITWVTATVSVADNSSVTVQGYGPAIVKIMNVAKNPPRWEWLWLARAWYQEGANNLISWHQLRHTLGFSDLLLTQLIWPHSTGDPIIKMHHDQTKQLKIS